jgi:DNA (cytosine-5)-methyltransferase 1
MKAIRFVDLFSGIGGMHLGFESAATQLGLKTDFILASEINKDAQVVYEKNFGQKPLGDIRHIQVLPVHEVMLAGFPCQTFSYSGKKAGFGDTRGTLFFEIMRLVDTFQPPVMIFENVAGLVSHDSGKTFRTIRHEVEQRGYSFDWFYMNSCNYGLPQNRLRVYMICLKGKKRRPFNLISDKGPSDSHQFSQEVISLFDDYKDVSIVQDILENDPSSKYDCSPEFVMSLQKALKGKPIHGVRLIDYRGGHSIHSWELGLRGKCTAEEIDFLNEFILERRKKKFGKHRDGKFLTFEQIASYYPSQNLSSILTSLVDKGYLKMIENGYKPVAGNFSFEVFKFLDPNKISITLTSSDTEKLGICHNSRIRRITPREAARLQGFPDTFTLHFDDRKAYFQIGNAVSVRVAEVVALEALQVSGLAEDCQTVMRAFS